MSKHLILGGTGFVGRQVALSLARTRHKVTIAGRSPSADIGEELMDRVQYRQAEINNTDLDALIGEFDVVHHYAWSTIPETANADPIADLDSNVRGTLRLLEAMRRRGRGRVLFSSSGGTVYGPLHSTPASEDHPLNPISAYGISKLAAEKYLGLYRSAFGLDCRIARISNPFGASQSVKRNQGAASIFTHRARLGQPISIWGNGEVVRDYLHVSDTAAGLCELANAPPETLGKHWTFNLSSGTGTSLNSIVHILVRLLNRPVNVTFAPARSFDIPVNILDPSLLQSVLSWKPRYSFEEGLRVDLDVPLPS